MNFRLRTALALALPMALTGCFLMPGAAPGGAMGPQGGQSAPSAAGESTPTGGAPSTNGSPNSNGAPSTPEKPKPVSMSIDMKNECPNTVHLFFGEKPGFSSGRSSTLGSNTLSSEGRDFDGSLMIWVTDDHEHGLASVKVAPSQRKATIGSDCKSIHAE